MINRLHQNCLGRASARFVNGMDVQRTYLVANAVNVYESGKQNRTIALATTGHIWSAAA